VQESDSGVFDAEFFVLCKGRLFGGEDKRFWSGFEVEAVIAVGDSDYGAAVIEVGAEEHNVAVVELSNGGVVYGLDFVGDIIFCEDRIAGTAGDKVAGHMEPLFAFFF